MNSQIDPTPSIVAASSVLTPDGWQETPTGLRSSDGQHTVKGVRIGCDPAGEFLIITKPDGSEKRNYRISPDDLAEQLEVALRTTDAVLTEEAREHLAGDLRDTAYVAVEQAQNDFLESLVDGKLMTLLAGDIGDRHPWDVAHVMRHPVPRPILLKDWLVAAELHWIAAEPAAGKTWLGLWLALRVIQDGGTVVWTDEELGVDTVAERLIALGADPSLVESNFVYFPYPGWSAREGDAKKWGELIKAARPSLVVIDTATDALAMAGVDENSGAEVTAWVKAYCEPPRRIGAAVLVLDHVPKSDTGAKSGYAVGSRAKKAKAKVQYSLSKKKDFTKDRVGLVQVTLDKNSFGLNIEPVRTFKMGGQDGRFVIERASLVEAAEADGAFDETAEEKREAKAAALRDSLIEAIREHGPLNTTDLKKRVGGKAEGTTEALKTLVAGSEYPVEVKKKGGAKIYSWVGD